MIKEAPRELLIATSNQGKVAEFQTLLASMPVRLRGLTEFPGVIAVEETGVTFAENAILKASAYAGQTGVWALADDSGLEVDALNGAPGVFSARYGGEGLTDSRRIDLLLEEMSQRSARGRRARFVCVIAIADRQGQIVNISKGKCEGRIAPAPRGGQGFGYDPIFIPDGFEQTFGELPTSVKQLISHRALALQAARSFLSSCFRSTA
jgi:XTP/dITP diphosphohydrolase